MSGAQGQPPENSLGKKRSLTARTLVLDVPEHLERAFHVVKELRTHLTLDEFSRLVKLAIAADGYRLVAREIATEEGGEFVAVMGYRILHDLSNGSYIAVDELVTLPNHRSKSHGAELLRYAETESRRLGLNGLKLSSQVDNKRAQKFFEREGFTSDSQVYQKKATTH